MYKDICEQLMCLTGTEAIRSGASLESLGQENCAKVIQYVHDVYGIEAGASTSVDSLVNECILYSTEQHVPIVDLRSDKILKAVKELDNIEVDGVSGEGMLLRAFNGILNIFSESFYAFTTNVTRFSKPIKRSELRYYSQAKPTHVNTVSKVVLTMMDRKIPYPANMLKGYGIAIETIHNAYGLLDMNANMKDFINLMDKIAMSLYKAREDTTAVRKLERTVEMTFSRLEKLNYDSIFTTEPPRHQKDKRVKDLFKSGGEYATVMSLLLSMEPNLTGAARVSSQVRELQAKVERMVKYLEQNQQSVPKEFIKALGILIASLARYIEFYGRVVIDHLAVEHNIVLSTQQLYKEAVR